MKKFLYSLVTLALIASAPCVLADTDRCPEKACRDPKTFFLPRSQSVNAARNIVGIQRYIHKAAHLVAATPNEPCTELGCNSATAEHSNGFFATTLEYTRSFRPNLITDYLFGQAANNGVVVFSGSKAPNRGEFEILADYFGLPQDFRSNVSFCPRIENFIVDFDFYLGLDKWIKCAYFRVHMPLVYTRWSLNQHEHVYSKGSLDYPYGYMTQEQVQRSNLPDGVLDTFEGGIKFGDMKTPLEFGKIHKCKKALTKTRLSDVQLALGWNFVANDKGHMGIMLRSSLPAGNKPTGEYLFEPIVGNGGHYELGAGFTTRMLLWEHECNNQSLTFYCDVNATHIFNTKQIRSFDLDQNGPGSRYMLLEQFKKIKRTEENKNPVGSLSNPGIQDEYAGSLHHTINFTTFCTDVKIQFQADAVLKLAYTWKGFEFDLGYNFWGRTKEQLSFRDEFPNEAYGIKGDAFLYGAAVPTAGENTVDGALPARIYNKASDARTAYIANTPNSRIPLSAIQQDNATFYSGGNYTADTTCPELNPGVDGPTGAETRSDPTTSNTSRFVYSPNAGVGDNTTKILTSNPIDFIDQGNNEGDEFDVESAAVPSVVTHKIFINVAHNWRRDCRVQPFVSGGFEIEFDAARKDLGKKSCDCRSALNQWGAFVKGGIGF